MIALLLCALQTAPAELEAWVRHGFPPGEVPARVEDDAAAAAAWDLAQLVPERVSGRAVTAEDYRAAAARALATVGELPEPLRALGYARLRGTLIAADLEQVAEQLQGGDPTQRPALDALLMTAAIEDAEAPLLALALDEQQPAGARGVYAEHLMLARGRPALEALRPAIRPDAAPQFLRRVLAGWRSIVAPEDLPWLEKLAREGKDYPAQFALQLWAMNERDPERRLSAFRLALGSAPSYRQVAWDALARGGPHEGIAEELLNLLDTGDADNRNLARRLLPLYAGPEALWEAYRERVGEAPPQVQAPWMATLAASPLPEARAEAARWLAEHGRTSGSAANAVARRLADDPEIDPFLPALLTQSELPDRVLFPLALRRAETSEAARDVLRERIVYEDGLTQQQAIRHLAPYASEADLQLIEDVARGEEYSAASRAEALVALASQGRAEGLLAEWMEAPPRGYEVAEAFVRATVEFGSEERFHTLTEMLARGLGFPDADEQRGVRIAAWQAAGRRADALALEFLAGELQRTLIAVPAEEGTWPSLYDLSRRHFELATALDALLQCALGVGPAAVDARLEQIPLQEVAPVARFLAAYRMGRKLPGASLAWFRSVDREALSEGDRLRFLAGWAWSLDPAPGTGEAYAALLAEAPLYARYPRPLAEAFLPQGAGWALFHDRIDEHARLLRARGLEGEELLAELLPLAQGRVSGAVLGAGAELLATDPSLGARGLDAAQGLCARRVALSPLSPDAHAQYGAILEAAGALEEAREAWGVVLRTVPEGTEQRLEAEEALRRLAG